MKTYITKVFEENGELGIYIPEDLMKDLNLIVGELLEFKMTDKDTIVITRTKVIHNNNNKE